ncbi:MAG: RNA pseudouridine synthase [Alphaproteobacteria bacterium]|nr:RNA pseudouridine synthase [Alphaproteobacteria bacterium]
MPSSIDAPIPVTSGPDTTPAIIGEHQGIIAVHKPAGMRVHPATRRDGEPEGGDLISWLDSTDGVPAGTRPIHRLDSPASGVVLCAPDPQVRGQVSQWLADGEIHRLYIALVHGRTRRKGIIRRPLQDARRGRPLQAVTRYRMLEWIGAFTLVQVRIESGRKHQIRRHMQGIGHAIVGDERYPPPRFRAVPAFPGRLWLHALALQLPDETIFESPLPPALERHLAHLESIRVD